MLTFVQNVSILQKIARTKKDKVSRKKYKKFFSYFSKFKALKFSELPHFTVALITFRTVRNKVKRTM